MWHTNSFISCLSFATLYTECESMYSARLRSANKGWSLPTLKNYVLKVMPLATSTKPPPKKKTTKKPTHTHKKKKRRRRRRREIITFDRQGTQQQKPQLPTLTTPGMRVNTRYITPPKVGYEVEFMYLVFIHVRCSYHKRFRSLVLCPLSVKRCYFPSSVDSTQAL